MFVRLSYESEELLKEIIDNENNLEFINNRYNSDSKKESAIIKGCLKELSDRDMIDVRYADNGPYSIDVLKDGYLYEEHLYDVTMSPFKKKLNDLLERTKTIKSPVNAAPIGVNIDDYNSPAEEWMNDVQIFHDRYLKNHPLSDRINNLLFHRGLGAYKEIIACLKSVSNDEDFIDSLDNKNELVSDITNKERNNNQYDVFVSHANYDKEEFVQELVDSLSKLGINIFYDKDSINWGDNWKKKILDGTEKSEFAIIVISENFFGREWTERELKEFLNRQNKSGQKIILPILHNITIDDLRKKYPSIADIQALSSKQKSCDEIAILFAKEFIERLKNN